MAARAVHLSITGRVQGVGYRAWFEREARRLVLNGWVRNRRDGSVECVVSGEGDSVTALIERAWSGPSAARVDAVEVGEAEAIGESFEIRSTE